MRKNNRQFLPIGRTRKYLRLLSGVLIFLLVFGAGVVGCQAKKEDKIVAKAKKQNTYTMDIVLHPELKMLEVKQNLKYRNVEGKALDNLYLHLYPNAFAAQGGGIVFTEGTKLDYTIGGKDNSILRVNLAKPLGNGDEIDLTMNYMVKLPSIAGRFGDAKGHMNVSNFYPIAAVYDKDWWHLDQYSSIGDPFFSDVADYDVTITAPAAYTIAATGNETATEEVAAGIKHTFTAENMRDFAFVAGTDLDVTTEKVGKTVVSSYYLKGQEEAGEQALRTAKSAIVFYNGLYGQYPYANFVVVPTALGVGENGMSYPGIAMINDSYYVSGGEELDAALVHEVAHQWFGGLVGNNGVEESWMDEGMASYSEILYQEVCGDAEAGRTKLADYISYTNRMKDAAVGKLSVQTSLSGFKNVEEYKATSYIKATVFINQLREEMGDDAFFQAAKAFVSKYSYNNAGTSDFIDTFQSFTEQDLMPMYYVYFTNTEFPAEDLR